MAMEEESTSAEEECMPYVLFGESGHIHLARGRMMAQYDVLDRPKI